jgi:hypothetical protein
MAHTPLAVALASGRPSVGPCLATKARCGSAADSDCSRYRLRAVSTAIKPTTREDEMLDTGRKFYPGAIVATPGAIEAASRSYLSECLQRHLRGDWGDLDDHDKQANESALAHGARLLSAYPLPGGGTIWVITEADRSVTTFLLPDEY